MLNPVFSIAHMRQMGKYCVSKLTVHSENQDSPYLLPRHVQAEGRVAQSSQGWSSRGKSQFKKIHVVLTSDTPNQLKMDLLLWMNRTALELVGQSGLGYSFDSLEEDRATHRYSTSAKQLV